VGQFDSEFGVGFFLVALASQLTLPFIIERGGTNRVL